MFAFQLSTGLFYPPVSRLAGVVVAGIQVLRFESRSKLNKALLKHIQGVTRPPTARTFPSVVSVHPPVELGAIVPLAGAGVQAAREAIERTRPTGRGRRPNECLDVLLAGPPPYGPEQWSDARELEWARESYAWLRDVVGTESVIVAAALHRDETSPHLHVLVVPIAGRRRSWKRVRDAAVKAIASRSPPAPGRKSRGVHRDAYRALQDDYQARVGVRFNLARGEVGSEATHAQIDRAKATEARAALAEARAADAEHDARVDALLSEVAEDRLDEAKIAAADEAARSRRARQAVAADLERRRVSAAELADLRVDIEREKAAADREHDRREGLAREVAELDAQLAGKRRALGDLDEREAKLADRARDVGQREVAVRTREVRAYSREDGLATRERALAPREAAVDAFERDKTAREAALERTNAAAVEAFKAETAAGDELAAKRDALGRLQREAEETKTAADREHARRERLAQDVAGLQCERDEAERDAGTAAGFDAPGFAGLVLRAASALRVELPPRLADVLASVVEQRSAAPLLQLVRGLREREVPHKRRARAARQRG